MRRDEDSRARRRAAVANNRSASALTWSCRDWALPPHGIAPDPARADAPCRATEIRTERRHRVRTRFVRQPRHPPPPP
jgi:hypothetical protein